MGVAKVILNGDTLMDVTQKTVASNNLLSGATALGADGEGVSGGILTKSAADLTTSGSTVTVPAGYYATQATKNVASASAFPPAMSLNSSTGVITGTNSFTGGYYDASTKTSSIQLTSKTAATYYPSTADQTVASNQYLTGTQTIKSVVTSNLTASNIASGVTVAIGDSANASRITQVTGTFQGGVKYTCTITGSGDSNNCYIKHNNVTKYYSAGTFEFDPGDTLYIKASCDGTTTFYLNDTSYIIESTTSGNIQKTLKLPPSNISINLSWSRGLTSLILTAPVSEITENGIHFTQPDIGAIVSVPGLVPSGTINITSNGTFDIASYASASVNAGVDSIYKSIYQRQVTGVNFSVVTSLLNQSTIIPSYAFIGWPDQTATGAFSLNYLYNIDNVTSIGKYAFASTSYLSRADFPNVEYIGSYAFYSCNSLVSISFPSAISIGDYAFCYCSSLSSISFPETRSIGFYAFSRCTKLHTINFPNVIDIKNGAFSSCIKLQVLDFPNVTSIGNYVFYNCTSLIRISAPNITRIGAYAFYNCTSLNSVSFSLVTSIEPSAFYNCYKLSSISFPNVTSIGGFAFYSCSMLSCSVDLTQATYIGENAFYGCIKISGAVSDSVLSSIYTNCFYKCSSIKEANFPSVKNVSTSAFQDCIKLSSISFPAAVSFGNEVFRNCTALTTVYLPEVTNMGSGVFSNCGVLSSVDMPKLSFIPSYCFYKCVNLRNINTPLATNINSNAFYGCNGLVSIGFQAVTSIGSYAFYECLSLANISFPAATYIGYYAFGVSSIYNAVNGIKFTRYLKSVYFPSVQALSNNAFLYRLNLRTVSFPAVTSIGNYVFSNCQDLTSAYFLGSSVPVGGTAMFDSTPIQHSSYTGAFGSIFVRMSLVDAFKSATNWALYSSRIVGLTDAEITELNGGSDTIDETKEYGPYSTAAQQTLGCALDSGLPKITQWSNVKIYGTVRVSTDSNFSSYKEYTVDSYLINPNESASQIALSYEKTGENPSGLTEFECTSVMYSWIGNLNRVNFMVNCPTGKTYAKFNLTITWSRDHIN